MIYEKRRIKISATRIIFPMKNSIRKLRTTEIYRHRKVASYKPIEKKFGINEQDKKENFPYN